MSTLVAVVFNDSTTAFEMRTALLKMQKEHLIELEDSVVVTRNDKGKLKLDQAVNLTSAGAIGGGFWGMLIGLIFLNPLLGAAVGATAGAVSGKLTDLGLSDQMMKDIAGSFKAEQLGALRPRASRDGRQSAERPERVCRQGQGLSDLAHQGRREHAARGDRGGVARGASRAPSVLMRRRG